MEMMKPAPQPAIIMSNLNKVILIGRLTRDPVIRYTPKGNACTEFGLALNRSYTSETGEKREETTFVDLTLWGKTAEIATKYLHKGNLTCVEGRLKLETWTDKSTGQPRSKLVVIGENMTFLEPASGSPQRTAPAAKAPSRPMAPATVVSDDDDLDEPF